MHKHRAIVRITRVAASLVLFVSAQNAESQCGIDQRPVAVSDAIQMTRIGVGSMDDDGPFGQVAHYSPDKKSFLVILKRGDLEQNTMVYSLIVFDAHQALTSSEPLAELEMSSTSNREGIKNVKWLKDNRTLLFVGEQPNTVGQVYSFNVITKRLTQITNHATPVTNFDTSDDGKTIFFEADPAPRVIVDTPQTERTGFAVDGQNMSELIWDGAPIASELPSFTGQDIFRISNGGPPKAITIEDVTFSNWPVSVSPDGRYAIIITYVRRVPDVWREYTNQLLHTYVIGSSASKGHSLVKRYLLINIETGEARPLIDAPRLYRSDKVTWIDGGRSVVVSGVYLPLTGVDDEEKESRKGQAYVVNINLPSLSMLKIASGAFAVETWDGEEQVLSVGLDAAKGGMEKNYRRSAVGWTSTEDASHESTADQPVVTYEEGMNSPPQLWISSVPEKIRRQLIRLNPGFDKLCFGKEERISWKATDGHEIEGGLYLPPDYHVGQRYPLVIQTHAFDPDRFWIDGPWASGYAAQPLAAKDIVVLQMGKGKNHSDESYRSTPMEGPRNMAAIEGAIDFLDGRGIIERDKVGILGFSRTVYHVAYTLTHSKYHFSAAILVDGDNGGFFQDVSVPSFAADFWALNGGPPSGDTLPGWVKNSPSFNIANVREPIRLEGHTVMSVLSEWEWYSLLSQIKRPVDFIILPRAYHTLVKPAQRMTSQQGAVDWFSFWLQGYERPNPEDADQYKRWEHLKALRDANDKTGEGQDNAPKPN